MQQDKNHYPHIDVAKGIGILLVVFGHNWLVVDDKGELFNIIFSFHMPLFFFLSGLFLKESVSLKKLTLSKIDSLLKPYLTTTIAISLAYVILKNLSPIDEIKNILYANGVDLLWTPLWFLPSLFASFIVAWLCLKLLSRLHFMMQHITIAVLFLGNIIILSNLAVLPFSIDMIFITSGFLLLGYFAKSYILNFNAHKGIALLALAIFMTCHTLFNVTIDLNYRLYDDVIISTLQAVTGIYLIIWISHYISANKTALKILSFLGANSLMIMIFHYYPQIKAFEISQGIVGLPTPVATLIALGVGITAPLIIAFILQRTPYVRALFYPFKKIS